MDNYDENKIITDTSDDTSKKLSELDQAIARLSAKLENLTPSTAGTTVISSSAKTKLIATVAFMIIAMVALVFSSYAWFTSTLTSSDNNIATGTAAAKVVELTHAEENGGATGTDLDPISVMPGYVAPREIYAYNDGQIPLYVRARTETAIKLAQYYDAEAASVDPSLIIFNINEENWIKNGDYYYYAKPLLTKQTTPELFSEITFSNEMGNMYMSSTITVKVFFEIVQASNNGANVFEAVGWPTNEQGGAS